MRILHVNKFLYRRGGAEGYMFDVASLQRDRGDVVEHWGMHHPENIQGLPLADTFAPHVELEPAPGGLAGLAAAARMVWHAPSRTGLERAIAHFLPDVVHYHNVYHQLSPSILRAVADAGIPSVMTLHDYKLACPNYQLLDHGQICQACVTGGTWNAARRRCKGGSLGGSVVLALESGIHRAINAYDPVDHFISPSHFLRQVMVRSGIAEDRIRTIHNVVDLPARPQAEVSEPRVVFAGRLSHEKGVETLVRAAGLLPDGVHVDIAGDGPLRAELEALAKRVAPGRVTFHGRLTSEVLAPLVHRCMAMAVPSRWFENQPMTILESFAASVPPIVTALGGMPELVDDGVQGLLVPHDDPAALAGAIRRLAENPEAARAMGRAGRKRLDREFTPASHLAALDEAYAVAGERRRAMI